MFRWLLPGIFLAATSACPGFGDKSLAELAGVSGALTWEADIKPIFANRCWQCHDGNGTGPNAYVTYDQVVAGQTVLRDRILVKKDMPEDLPMPDSERAAFDAWLLQGAPEGVATVEPDFGVDTPVTFNTQIGALFVAECTRCHGESKLGGLDLRTYSGFMAGGFGGTIHGDGDVDAAVIVQRLKGVGPIMPQGTTGLPTDQIELVESWISAGFPEGN